MKIILPIYYNQNFKTKKDKIFLVNLNWYRNAHYFISNDVKNHYKELVARQVKKPIQGKIRLNFSIFIKRKGSDGDNIHAIIRKFFLDALVDLKIIEDDNFEIVVGGCDNYFHDKKNPRAEIEVIKI